MIATDGECVAIASDHKDSNVLACRRNTSGDRGRPAVDRVQAVGVHVVRETRRAADTGDDHGVLTLDPELRHEALEGCEHGIVTAAGAPAHLLITGEVLAAQGLQRQGYAGKAPITLSRAAGRGRLLSGSWLIKLRMQLIDGGHGFVPSN